MKYPVVLAGPTIGDGVLTGAERGVWLGGETTASWATKRVLLGGFLQAEDRNFDHLAFSLGGQVTAAVMGVELGMTQETGNAQYAPTTCLRVAPYVTVGLVALSFRVDSPLAREGSRPARAAEGALVLAIKWPLHPGIGHFVP
jgi:hypothetical protein